MSRLEQLHKLREADPSDADVPYMIAQEHAKAGDHAEAIRWFDTCLEIKPSYHYAYFHKARSQEAAGDVVSARETVRNGFERARSAGDEKATAELSEYMASLGA